MWHAVTFALLDSINLLLIGVVVVMGVVLPPSARYNRTAALLIGGDWLGVFLVSIPVLALLDQVRSKVEAVLNSPILGWALIAVGVLGLFSTLRGTDTSGLVNRIMEPLREPTLKTALAGFILGVVQSITSWPFYTGLAFLATGDFSTSAKYVGLLGYASLALSLPALTAILVGFIRHYPESPAGRVFAWSQKNSTRVSAFAGYFVAAALIAIGIGYL
ncbi:hypothetical protein QVA66_02990 [Staphylococcus chromogenes]|nr:hypothetical protein [Staphylococcus chromogenes]